MRPSIFVCALRVSRPSVERYADWAALADDRRSAEAKESGLLVRYVDRQIALVEGSSKEVEGTPFFVDKIDEDEHYYLTDHPCEPPPLGAVVVYSSDGLRGWSLLRMTPMRAAQLRERDGQFLWALPARYNVQSWLGKQSSAKAVQQEAADVVRGLLEDIDADRLQRDVEALALIDPQAGSVPGNYRSRFVLHPDMRKRPSIYGESLPLRSETKRFIYRHFRLAKARLDRA